MLSEVGLDEATVLERITCALNSEERPTLLSTGKIGVGLGMVSDILRVKVQWKNKTNYPQSFVIKVPSTHKMVGLAGDDCAANMSDHSLKEFHRGEIAAYIWLPCSERLGLKTPKCYFSQEIGDTDPGMLIIEDLSLAPNKGAVITTELSLAQIEEVMQQLAVLHGTSLIDDSWRSDDRLTKDIRPLLLENANWIAKSYEHACKEMMSKFPNELGEIAGRVLPALSDPTKDLTYMYTVNAEL
uniref:Aminoglycoside phosphotransferase domain-containing protein n=1 Tax=Plectus sambesii TaxID=2011161 RepID=A0A914V385_9BILA